MDYKVEESLDLLAVYYRRLFPYELFYKWLGYGSNNYASRREIALTLLNDVYIRYLSFDTPSEFAETVQKKNPIRVNMGAVYQTKPRNFKNRDLLIPQEKEIIFDVDASDYDEIRKCCSGNAICKKCWKFMAIAVKVLDVGLREDFDYGGLLWVFSGRRGVHCLACDKNARKLNEKQRTALARYFQLLEGGEGQKKLVCLGENAVHPSIRRAIAIIDQYFLEILEEQDLLGTNERLSKFLAMLDENQRERCEKILRECTTSLDRWMAFVQYYNTHQEELGKNVLLEIKLQYAYPRLDIQVSEGLNHLLKAPFCVHPKTGKVCVPFSSKTVDEFDPNKVPTLSLLVDEIKAFDETRMTTESKLADRDDYECMEISSENIQMLPFEKDYKYTSLTTSVCVLEEFLTKFEMPGTELNDLF